MTFRHRNLDPITVKRFLGTPAIPSVMTKGLPMPKTKKTTKAKAVVATEQPIATKTKVEKIKAAARTANDRRYAKYLRVFEQGVTIGELMMECRSPCRHTLLPDQA
jgi:hypothetical protein